MADYFVKTTGNDGLDGLSDANAWATIGKVNGFTFSGGDSISFNRGDTWTDAILNPADAGSSGNPITFKVYGSGALPILDAQNTRIQAINCLKDWLNFEDLDCRDGTGDTVFVQAANCNFIRLDVSLAGNDGLRFSGSATANNTIDGGRFHNNGSGSGHGVDFQSGAHDNTTKNFESDNNLEDGVQWNSASGDNNTVDNANIHDNTENALDCKTGTGHKCTNSSLQSTTQDVVIIQSSTAGFTLEDNDIFLQITTTGRVLLVTGLSLACTIVSRRNKYRGSGTTDQTVKLHNAPSTGSLNWTSKADVFDDENQAGSFQVRLRNACTATFDGCTFFKQHATGGCFRAAGGSVITMRNTGFRSNGGSWCVQLGSGGTKVFTNNGYRREGGGDVVNDNGIFYDEIDVTTFDAAAKVGDPTLASVDETNANYMRPNEASPWDSTGDDAFGPANDNNNDLYDVPNKNIGALSSTFTLFFQTIAATSALTPIITPTSLVALFKLSRQMSEVVTDPTRPLVKAVLGAFRIKR